MVRTVNSRRNVRMVETTGAASLVERVGGMACKLVWTAVAVGVLALVVVVVLG